MGRPDRLAGLAVLVSLGCSFDAAGSDPGNLGSAGATSGPTTEDSVDGSTGASESGSAEGETSVGGSTSVGSDEACVDTCVAQVPSGWQGPFYVADAANPIDCPNGYNAIDVAYTGLVAPPAECGCSCTETPATCEVDFLLSIFSCPAGLQRNLASGQCESHNTLGADVHIRASLGGSPVGCTANAAQTVPPATWGSTSTLCAAPASGGDCGGDRCTATPPEGVSTRLCISKEGETDCPGAGYEERTVMHRSFEDQRSCQGCNCSGPPTCTGQAFVHDNASCSGDGQLLEFDVCVDANVSGDYGISAMLDGGSCTSTQAAPAGQATPTGAVTICCAS